MELPIKELARQLAIYEQKLFCKISPIELRSGVWSKPNKKELAPHVCLITAWFNKVIFVHRQRLNFQLSFWLATEILQQSLKQRVRVISKSIKLAEVRNLLTIQTTFYKECRKLNNFNSLMSILAAVGMSSIQRLKRTWKLVPEKYKDLYNQLEELMSGMQNYRNYRIKLEKQMPPVLPYLGVFLRDLLFIEEGNRDVLENGMINFDKMRMVAGVFTSLQKCQKVIIHEELVLTPIALVSICRRL